MRSTFFRKACFYLGVLVLCSPLAQAQKAKPLTLDLRAARQFGEAQIQKALAGANTAMVPLKNVQIYFRDGYAGAVYADAEKTQLARPATDLAAIYVVAEVPEKFLPEQKFRIAQRIGFNGTTDTVFVDIQKLAGRMGKSASTFQLGVHEGEFVSAVARDQASEAGIPDLVMRLKLQFPSIQMEYSEGLLLATGGTLVERVQLANLLKAEGAFGAVEAGSPERYQVELAIGLGVLLGDGKESKILVLDELRTVSARFRQMPKGFAKATRLPAALKKWKCGEGFQ